MTDPVVLLSSGDVVGPNSSTDGTMVLFDGTSGKKVKGNNAVVTAQGLSLLDDVDAAANRATIGLNLVNNTSDANKPVSTPQQNALDNKANKGANSDITSISGLTTALSVPQGGTGLTTLNALAIALGLPTKAANGANSDITSIAGLTTALSVLQGGTGVTTMNALALALGLNLKAANGANSDITSIAGLTTMLAVNQGGTGVNNLNALAIALGMPGKAPLNSAALTGAPTAPTAPFGTNTTQLATTEFAQSIISGVLSGNGALVFPNGVILQWGTTPTIGDGSSLLVSLPITFPNASWGVLASINTDVSGDTTNVRSAGGTVVSLSQIRISVNANVNYAYPVFWFAIGR